MSIFNSIANKTEFSNVYEVCLKAEQAKSMQEMATLCRKALGLAIEYIYAKESKRLPEKASMLELIDGEVISGFIDNAVIVDSIHFVRKLGMNAQHGMHIKRTQAQVALQNIAFFLQFIDKKYTAPSSVKDIVLPPYMSEAATRKIYIDLYLNEAGWDVLEPNSKTILADGTEVASGTVFPGKACSEIPVQGLNNVSGIGFCDYVLYGKDGKPLAIVEAKKTSVEAQVGEYQVIQYGKCMQAEYGYTPVLYYTNGYDIYVIDGLYPSRKLVAFHALEELELLIAKRNRGNIADFQAKASIVDRPYQTRAITKICEILNDKFRRSLLVMATGTGKTRVAIALVDLLTRNNWIKRVLFLADRTSLVEQAFKNFQKYLPNTTYCVLSDKKLANDDNARIVLSTHQTMINFIDAENKEFTCGYFDLVIVDEAHRSIFNKYGAIFTYFDSFLIGLTATPKEDVDANTYQIFGCETGEPDFAYNMDDAVKDKYLVPYKEERRTTKLLERGIRYKDLSDEDKAKVDTVLMEDDHNDDTILPKETLFRLFYNSDTCGRVLDDLMTHGLQVENNQKIGKTIIFAYNHRHAEQIVEAFKKNYPSYGNDYCQLIDRHVKNADDRIISFEENEDFRIAVSVDMLDTGIDVPSVLNLVLFKPIKSKIKFVQMLGRGTRLCPNLIDGEDKKYFLVFDYCGNFAYFGANPPSETHSNGKSLSQKLFDLRLDILTELQSYKYQADEVCKKYYDKLKPSLFAKVQEVKQAGSRISVREKMAYVDKFCDYEEWQAISPLAKKEIQLHLSRLIANDLKQDRGALIFDGWMLNVELSVLVHENISNAQLQVGKIRNIAKTLLEKSSSMPAVFSQSNILKTLVGTEFWSNPTLDKLELYRETVRELMKYLPPPAKPVNINVRDSVRALENDGVALVDIRTYKEKVLEYLAEHGDNPVIHKIQNLEPINAADLKVLERILWHDLGTHEDYLQTTNIENLAVFMRSLVGIDQKAINSKFGKFLNENFLNSRQQEFILAMIDYVRQNGDIQTENLVDESPFDSVDIKELFGANTPLVADMVKQLHGCVMVA
jgi:type I restriction enzyme R subunit